MTLASEHGQHAMTCDGLLSGGFDPDHLFCNINLACLPPRASAVHMVPEMSTRAFGLPLAEVQACDWKTLRAQVEVVTPDKRSSRRVTCRTAVRARQQSECQTLVEV